MHHVGRTRPRGDGQRLVVVRRRRLGATLHERIEVRNHTMRTAFVNVDVMFGADFADVFAVKEGRPHDHGERRISVDGERVVIAWSHLGISRTVTVTATDAVEVHSDRIRWSLSIEPQGISAATWGAAVHHGASCEHSGAVRSVCADDEVTIEDWVASAPTLQSPNHSFEEAFRRSVSDLGALRLIDATGARRPVIAAGAPWFMTLFGRDSLLTAYMALPCDPTLALGVLDALAELQGTEDDDATEEEPGRILHELRFQGATSFALDAGRPYFGSIDSTPLFVVLLAEAARWGLPADEISRLLPHADRALAWIERRIAADPHGLLSYQRRTEHGLEHQGWKDSWDGIRHTDGSVASTPLALCEVQGYVYAAFVGRSELAAQLGHHDDAAHWAAAAEEFRNRFDALFWLPELGRYATAIESSGRVAASVTSNLGHCLWSGIVPPAKAPALAAALRSPAMWSGWGVRTLAADEPGFDPLSYHCGSVWPHDSAIVAAGLAHYGFRDDAARIVSGLCDAADVWDGRMPELFAGFDKADVAVPVSYPTSCSPQAWAAAAAVLAARLVFGIEPDLLHNRVTWAPETLPGFAGSAMQGVRFWNRTLDCTSHPSTGRIEATVSSRKHEGTPQP